MRASLVMAALLLAACTAPAPAVDPPASPDAVSPATVTATVGPTASPAAEVVATPPPSATAALPAPIATQTLSPTAMPTPEPERLLVTGGGSQAVNMRVEPGTNAAVLKSVRDGTEVIVVGTDREADGRLWRNVRDGDAAGWIVSTALRSLPTPTVTPSSTATPAATPTLAATPSPPTTPTPSPSVASAPATSTATASPTPSPEAERVEVYGTGGQGANLRAEPGTTGRVLQTMPDGTRLTVIGPDREVGGRTWRNVRGESGAEGWLVGDAVRSLEAPTPVPTETTTPTPSSPPTATVTPSPGGTPPASGTPSATASPEAGVEEPTHEPERVEVYGTGQGANLRATPGRSGSVLQSVPDGSRLTVVGEDQDADSLTWRHVQTDDGLTGWLATEVIKTIVTPTPTPRPGAPGIGAPIPAEEPADDQRSDAERDATPCRPGQLKGDAATGIYYPPDHPEYAGLLQRVRCFDDASRARASGFRPAETPEPSPSPAP